MRREKLFSLSLDTAVALRMRRGQQLWPHVERSWSDRLGKASRAGLLWTEMVPLHPWEWRPKEMSLFISQAWQRSFNLKPKLTRTLSPGLSNHELTVLNAFPEIPLQTPLCLKHSGTKAQHLVPSPLWALGHNPGSVTQISFFTV